MSSDSASLLRCDSGLGSSPLGNIPLFQYCGFADIPQPWEQLFPSPSFFIFLPIFHRPTSTDVLFVRKTSGEANEFESFLKGKITISLGLVSPPLPPHFFPVTPPFSLLLWRRSMPGNVTFARQKMFEESAPLLRPLPGPFLHHPSFHPRPDPMPSSHDGVDLRSFSLFYAPFPDDSIALFFIAGTRPSYPGPLPLEVAKLSSRDCNIQPSPTFVASVITPPDWSDSG